MDLGAILSGIPYLEVHSLDVDATRGGARVRMPKKRELTNHVNIVHAGAMFTAAETAAGIAVFGIVPDGRAVVLLREATVRYTRRALGDVVAVADVPQEVADAARAAFSEGGRAEARADVIATDAEGETVFRGSFDYALRRRSA